MYRFKPPAGNKPTLFINVFSFDGKEMPLEGHGVATGLEEAVRDARDFEDEYRYTLTDVGQVDLSQYFSEGFHEQRDHDAAVDAAIDAVRDGAI
jgi:hypothetical protein